MIFDISRFAVHDGPGIRTTVFMKGCPLRCWWCHNPESQSEEAETWTHQDRLDEETFERFETIGREYESADLMRELLKDRVFWEESGGGITFSGGEPLLQAGFLTEMLDLCNGNAIPTAIDTCGHIAHELFCKIAPLASLFLYDLKLMDDRLHKKYTGASNALILQNLYWLVDHKIPVILRRPVIPGINDTDDEMASLKILMKELSQGIKKIHLLPYHSIARNKYKKTGTVNRLENLRDLKEADLLPMKAELETTGWEVVIGG